MYDVWYDMIWYDVIYSNVYDIKFLITHPQGSPDAVYAKPDKSAKKKLQEEENKKCANLSGRGNYLALINVCCFFFSEIKSALVFCFLLLS